ncbi:DUF3823 domain-containing protein [Mucilaginibacter sp. JRF]|uniref:DUF3823 domain-containing protein n=1 Tax=Mucilaginibacter sp. JRF TaxID=2780088 RepID=UPI001881A0B2|nr:DUF3823 domain-containing protein [Mucilaginibacter sp. JRF]MBE9586057.1 DUF3823 domain-containing protein [Mucilaginibacter sp. JRF]
MKLKFHYIILIALTVMAVSCKKDTLEAPKSKLTGRLVYNGQAINVEQNRVPIELYQKGFGLVGDINGTAAQDGSYSFLLFDGNYQLIIPNNQGPFRWNQTGNSRDTLNVTVNGDQTLDLEVTPFYLITNAQYSANGRAISATFGIDQIITDANARDIESVTLFVNKTQFVSGRDNLKSASVAGSAITNPASVTLTTDALDPIVGNQNYVFARVGLKIANVEDLIFSPLQKVTIGN